MIWQNKCVFNRLIITSFFIFFSYYIYGDERARGNNCYLALGYIEGKSKVVEFASKTGYDPTTLELFERKDKKIYFTLGLIDEDLYKSLKRQSLTSENMWCTSGKGYLKRYNLDQDYNLISNNPKKFKVSNKEQFLSLISPDYKSAKKVNTDKNTSTQLIVEDNIQKVQETSSLYEISFGDSKQAIIMNKYLDEIYADKKIIDEKIISSKKLNGIVGFQHKLRQWNPGDYSNRYNPIPSRYENIQKTIYANFAFAIYENPNYEGYLLDLEGNKFLNPNIEHKIVALKPDARYGKNYWSLQFDEPENFFNILDKYDLYKTMIDTGLKKGLDELKLIYPSAEPSIKNIKWDIFYSQNFLKGDPRNRKSLDGYLDYREDRNGKVEDLRYFGNNKRYTEEWVSKSRHWDYCLDDVSLRKTLYILAPVVCMEYIDSASNSIKSWSWNNDVGKLKLVKEVDFLQESQNAFDNKLNVIKKVTEEYKRSPNTSFVTFVWNSSHEKICTVTQGDEKSDELITFHVAYGLSKGNKSKIIERNSNKKIFNDLNSLYLEISQIKQDNCGIIALKVDDFARLIEPMNNEVFKMSNEEIINKFFTNDDINNSFALAYNGLNLEKINLFKAITLMEVTPENSNYFIELENEFIKNKIVFSQNNFKIYSDITNQAFGNTYLSNIINVLKIYSELKISGVDITGPDFQNSFEENRNIFFLKDKNKLNIYRDLIVNLNMNISEINSLFNVIRLMDKENLYNFNAFNEYLDALVKITKSDNELMLKDYINGKLIDNQYAMDDYIKKLSVEKREREALAAKEERERRERQRLAEQERKRKYAAEYPIKIRVTCEMNGRPMNVGQCFLSSGKYGNDGQISVSTGGNSYEETALDLFRSQRMIWEKDIKGNSCYISAQKSNDDYFKLKLQAISNSTNSVLQTKSCSGPYCVVSIRC